MWHTTVSHQNTHFWPAQIQEVDVYGEFTVRPAPTPRPLHYTLKKPASQVGQAGHSRDSQRTYVEIYNYPSSKRGSLSYTVAIKQGGGVDLLGKESALGGSEQRTRDNSPLYVTVKCLFLLHT